MSDLERAHSEEPEGRRRGGPNLLLIYGLLALALVVATALAALIVHPFFARS
jgi:hypothetical protein